MNTQEQDDLERQRAWALLGTIEGHPKVQAWLAEAEPVDRRHTRLSRRLGGVWTRTWAAAAVTLAIGIGAGAYVHLSVPHYETRVGEQRDVILADGSRVTLNTDTALSVRYSARRRFIDLERGEALFAVKHDAARPFDVAAGGTLTRALGTEFNVDMRPTRVMVSVLDGAVKVTAGDSAANPASSVEARGSMAAPVAALAKGQAVEFRPQQGLMFAEEADLVRINAWRTRRLEFSNTPLTEAVEEFNRYSTTHVTIGSPELTEVRVTGIFRIGDTAAFLYSLREALGVAVHETGNEVVLMRTGA